MSGVAWPNGSTSQPRLTSPYGPRGSFNTPGGATSSFHAGDDYVGFSIICSPVDGVVQMARYNGGYGNYVRIRGDNGFGYGHAHIAPAGFKVREGQRVRAGQPVGVMGTTGRSTGVHLHWEVYPNNGSGTMNPRQHMAATARPAGLNVTELEEDMKLDQDDFDIIEAIVWGTGDKKHAGRRTMIRNSSSGRDEYPATTLGFMQQRVRDEVVKPALAEQTRAVTAAVVDVTAKAVADAMSGGQVTVTIDPDAVAEATVRLLGEKLG